MAKARPRPLGYYVVKAVRISGWCLLVLMVLYIVSGYALSGTLGFDRLMDVRTAEALHLYVYLDWPLVGLLVVHVAGVTYLSMRRWGWIGPRKRKS